MRVHYRYEKPLGRPEKPFLGRPGDLWSISHYSLDPGGAVGVQGGEGLPGHRPGSAAQLV